MKVETAEDRYLHFPSVSCLKKAAKGTTTRCIAYKQKKLSLVFLPVAVVFATALTNAAN